MVNLIRLLKFQQIRTKSIYNYSPLNECINIVKSRDYENYLSLLLMKNNELKRFGLALRAFNCEIASIKDLAKNRDVARFRFHYWSQTIDKLFMIDYYPPINEPVASELKKCLENVNFKVSAQWFKKLIESRKNNLVNFPFSTINELELYEEQSVSPIYYLLIEYAIRLGCFDDLKDLNKIRIDLDHIASHLGKSQGLLNLLRGLFRNALIEECFIPNDLLIKHKCSHEDIIRLCYHIQKSTESDQIIDQNKLEKYKFKNLLDLTFDLATLSKQHLNAAIQIYNKQKLTMKQTNYIFLPIYIVNIYLNDLEQNQFNILDQKLFLKRKQNLPIKLYFNSFEFKRLK